MVSLWEEPLPCAWLTQAQYQASQIVSPIKPHQEEFWSTELGVTHENRQGVAQKQKPKREYNWQLQSMWCQPLKATSSILYYILFPPSLRHTSKHCKSRLLQTWELLNIWLKELWGGARERAYWIGHLSCMWPTSLSLCLALLEEFYSIVKLLR